MCNSAQRGFTVWLTGLSGSGKTTLAQSLRAQLVQRRYRVEILDGDEIRSLLSADLGFSRADRDSHVDRIGFLANRLARNCIAVIVAAISPYRSARDKVRIAHEVPFIEVFVDCSLDELQRRDPKGLYKRALNGELHNFTGVSAPYEDPQLPDVHVQTDKSDTSSCTDQIIAELHRRGLVCGE